MLTAATPVAAALWLASHAGPNELSHPGYVLRSAATGALLQYLLVHVSGVLTSQQGLGLVISLYVAHSLATDLTWVAAPAQRKLRRAAMRCGMVALAGGRACTWGAAGGAA